MFLRQAAERLKAGSDRSLPGGVGEGHAVKRKVRKADTYCLGRNYWTVRSRPPQSGLSVQGERMWRLGVV